MMRHSWGAAGAPTGIVRDGLAWLHVSGIGRLIVVCGFGGG